MQEEPSQSRKKGKRDQVDTETCPGKSDKDIQEEGPGR